MWEIGAGGGGWEEGRIERWVGGGDSFEGEREELKMAGVVKEAR